MLAIKVKQTTLVCTFLCALGVFGAHSALATEHQDSLSHENSIPKEQSLSHGNKVSKDQGMSDKNNKMSKDQGMSHENGISKKDNMTSKVKMSEEQ